MVGYTLDGPVGVYCSHRCTVADYRRNNLLQNSLLTIIQGLGRLHSVNTVVLTYMFACILQYISVYAGSRTVVGTDSRTCKFT
jgi:hypothetical protein